MKIKKTSSIRSQMVLFFSILLIIPLLFTAIYVYVTIETGLKQSYSRHQSGSVEILASEIEVWRQSYEDISLRIFGDRLIQQFLQVNEWAPNVELLSLRTDVRNRLVWYEEYNQYLRAIYVMNDHSMATGRLFDPRIYEYFQEKVQQADFSEGILWDSDFDEHSIVMLRPVVDNHYDLNRRIGYLLIVLDREEILNTFQQFELDQGQQFALTDHKPEGLRISTSAEPLDPQIFPSNGSNRKNNGYITFHHDGVDYAYFSTTRNGWTLSTWIAESHILEPVRRIMYAYVFVTICLLIFTILMIVFISHRITKPLLLLQRAMKHMGGGVLRQQVPVVRHDEIGMVASMLNRMSEQIMELIEKNREEEANRRRLELRTLEYQINPHFLYNALDSVNMLARKYDDPRISEIVTSLSRLFRIGLNQGKEIITVGAEVDHVRYYLRIQSIRFGDKLQWEIDMDPAVEPYKIIKFLLQPLVENSIIHGIRKRRTPGFVTVQARLEDGYVVLAVIDDGAGMTPEELRQVQQSLNEEEKEQDAGFMAGGFGLRNVHQRIQLHYGPEYGLDINSQKDAGTTVVIKLPAVLEAEER